MIENGTPVSFINLSKRWFSGCCACVHWCDKYCNPFRTECAWYYGESFLSLFFFVYIYEWNNWCFGKFLLWFFDLRCFFLGVCFMQPHGGVAACQSAMALQRSLDACTVYEFESNTNWTSSISRNAYWYRISKFISCFITTKRNFFSDAPADLVRVLVDMG